MMRAGFPSVTRTIGPIRQPAASATADSIKTNTTASLLVPRFLFLFIRFKSLRARRPLAVRTVAAAALAAVAAPQVVARGEDDVGAFAVEVFALDGRGRVFHRSCPHDFKSGARRPRGP